MSCTAGTASYFYPRSPCGERPGRTHTGPARGKISIHALLAESDAFRDNVGAPLRISIHALLAESDEPTAGGNNKNNVFLSTLSLRRATHSQRSRKQSHQNFYPRSPCGERRQTTQTCRAKISISIHALLAESDVRGEHHANSQQEFLSTLSLRRATVGQKRLRQKFAISIHALLAESDKRFHAADISTRRISIHALLAESDRERTSIKPIFSISIHALLAESDSDPEANNQTERPISIHALLAESDFASNGRLQIVYYFYPRSPCGERLTSVVSSAGTTDFYPRSPCGERPSKRFPPMCTIRHFYPRSPCGERRRKGSRRCVLSGISIHALLAESDQ